MENPQDLSPSAGASSCRPSLWDPYPGCLFLPLSQGQGSVAAQGAEGKAGGMWCSAGQGDKGVQCSGGGHGHVVYRGGQGELGPYWCGSPCLLRSWTTLTYCISQDMGGT